MRPKALLLLVALLAFVQGAKADDDIDDDIFEYEDDAKTIIVDLVMGQNPTTITIPASVEEVKEGAFAYATNLEELYIKGDPKGTAMWEGEIYTISTLAAICHQPTSRI